MKIRVLVVKLFHDDGRTDVKIILAFRIIAKCD